jgi:hypothetical protein
MFTPREMMRDSCVCAVLGSVLACCVPATAQERGNWRAANSPAQTITGDVGIGDEKMFINFSSFTIARIRDLEPGEVSSVFDADSGAGVRGSLYRLSIPGAKTFLHKHTLCGGEDTQWMATYVEGRSLHLAFFSGQKMPVFALDTIANSTDLCGRFSYAR